MVGRPLTAHYDHDGRLVDFEGVDNLFQDIDAPVREPLLQDAAAGPGTNGRASHYYSGPPYSKWGKSGRESSNTPPIKNYPFQVQGTSTLHYSGKTRYQGVKAAIVRLSFRKMRSRPPWRACAKGETCQLDGCGLKANNSKTRPDSGGARRWPLAEPSSPPDPSRPHERHQKLSVALSPHSKSSPNTEMKMERKQAL